MSFTQAGYCRQLGQALGFTSTNNRDLIGGYGLKVCQLMGAARAAWGASDPRFIGVIGFQAFSAQGASVGGINDLYRLKGGDLNGTTFPNYAAAGFPNYDTAPNRPVDNCQVLTYACYPVGSQCCFVDTDYKNPLNIGGPNAGPNTGVVGAADDWASGNSTQQTNALAFMDWDLRQGVNFVKAVASVSSSIGSPITFTVTNFSGFARSGAPVAFYTTGTFDAAVTAGKNYFLVNPSGNTFQISNTLNGTPINVVSGASTGTITFGVAGDQNFGGGQTLLVFSAGATGLGPFGIYNAWNILAANYGLNVELYEGGTTSLSPSETYCTGTLGLSAGYGTTSGVGGKIDTLLQAYKSSDLFKQLYLDLYSQFMAFSQSQTPSQYGVVANPASNAQFAIRTPDIFGASYKSFDAIQAYNA